MAREALNELIDRYCEAWQEMDAARRRELLASLWAEGATYTDPTVDARNLEELLAHIASVVARRPGAKVVRTSAVDAHHGVARFAWQLVQADGTRRPESVDVAWYSSDGRRIERILGFFGPLRPLNEP